VQGGAAWSIDSIAGLSLDAEFVELRAGWVSSQGVHFSVSETTVGFFGNTVLRDGFSDLSQFAIGAKRVRWGEVSQWIGRSTLFGRGLPLVESQPQQQEDQGTDLITTHVEQTEIAERVDVIVSVASQPNAFLHEAQLALHTRGYYDLNGDFVPKMLVRGGIVTLPEQWYYAQPGGQYIHFRYEAGFRFPVGGDTSKIGELSMALLVNDAEHLALYPFAVNSAHYRFNFTMRL